MSVSPNSVIFSSLLFLILGLVFGSFVSALSYRFPKEISVLKGRSFCPNCKKRIQWYDNIPLLSYLILSGKCRNCKKSISLRYPLIELSTGLGFLFLYREFAPNYPELLYALTIFCVLILIFIIDLEHRIIPDPLVFFGVFLVFIYYLLILNSSFFPSLFAGFLTASLLMSIVLATKGRGMGLGDVKFAVLGGMLVGLRLSLIWLFLAFLTGGTAGIILILGRRARLKDQIAFGPFLVIALGLTFLFGEKLLLVLGF